LSIWGICLKKQPQPVVITRLDRVIHSEAGSNTVRKLSIWVEIIHYLFQMHNGLTLYFDIYFLQICKPTYTTKETSKPKRDFVFRVPE